MKTDLNHDNQIDEALAALSAAVPPEGMDTRIAARLSQQIAAPVPSRLASLAPSTAWWRGALTGAAAAVLATGIFFFIAHPTSISHNPNSIATDASRQPDRLPQSAAIAVSTPFDSSGRPCLRPALRRATGTLQYPPLLAAQSPLNESIAPSRPAPQLPLTQQERQLARLVRTSDPRRLAALGTVEVARLDAERASDLAHRFDQSAAIADSGGTAAPSSAPSTAGPAPTPEPTETQPSIPPASAAPADTQTAPRQEDTI